MRQIINLNQNWLFTKDTTDVSLRTGEQIDLGIDRTCARQQKALELIPAEGAEETSTLYHLKGGKEIVPLFPGCVYYENERGGRCITFAGTPNTPFYYSYAFSFLNQSRKAQLVKLLSLLLNKDLQVIQLLLRIHRQYCLL